MQQVVSRLNRNLLLALTIALGYHGGLLFFTFKRTYDAYVHIFFGDHYARAWFDHWEPRWYTGFTMTSYPPGSHQTIALLSKVVGLQNGFIIAQTLAILCVIIGVYRFSKIWVSEEAAGYAALLATFSSSLTETMHVFGQLPTTFSLGFLLNALPYVYRWLDTGALRYMLIAWAMNAATTAGHHVTTLFGAVFFVAPVMAWAIVEKLIVALPDEPTPQPKEVSRANLKPLLIRYVRRILPVVMRCFVYGVGMILLLLLVVFPYWAWSGSDPITQVSIPHASRDSFIENTAAGLVFWIVPYGVMLPLLPYVVYKGLTTRAWPLTLSFMLMWLLGTGGTTPIPRMLLGGAFDILTLDRFTFWATIVMLPLLGEFVVSLRFGRFRDYLITNFNELTWYVFQFGFVVSMVIFSMFVANMTQFRRFQPEPIDVKPIADFLEKDEHYRWRYLTLGFGDQVAWLAANTTATSVDGNYHSARRLPELTTTPVERLEGAKFRGIPGIGSLQQFLAVPDKYNLKFTFSNDQFYDPLLYFSGWHRLEQLQNGIVVWEKQDVPPLPDVLPRKEIPLYQRTMWGVLPIFALVTGVLAMSFGVLVPLRQIRERKLFPVWIDRWLLARSAMIRDDGETVAVQRWVERVRTARFPIPRLPDHWFIHWLPLIFLAVAMAGGVRYFAQPPAITPIEVVEAYYDDLDFRRFVEAYERLDPVTRPDYERYLLTLNSTGGLLASYAKLDAIRVEIVREGEGFVDVIARTEWITSLNKYDSADSLRLWQRDGIWTVEPPALDVTQPPQTFVRQPTVEYFSADRPPRGDDLFAFVAGEDRPKLTIHSTRLVVVDERTYVVGEITNSDVDPADITVTAYLYDSTGETLSWYNAQGGMIHKLLPQESTPFRVDFEGVAGTAITETAQIEEQAGEFDPLAFTPITVEDRVTSYAVYGKGVVTGRNLYRGIGVQDVRWEDGKIIGTAINAGTQEATLPHVLVTFYDENGRVAWMEHHYLAESVKPQREVAFEFGVISADAITQLDVAGGIFDNDFATTATMPPMIALPPESGFAGMRITIHAFVR